MLNEGSLMFEYGFRTSWEMLCCLFLQTSKIFPMQWMLLRLLISLACTPSANATGNVSHPFYTHLPFLPWHFCFAGLFCWAQHIWFEYLLAGISRAHAPHPGKGCTRAWTGSLTTLPTRFSTTSQGFAFSFLWIGKWYLYCFLFIHFCSRLSDAVIDERWFWVPKPAK